MKKLSIFAIIAALLVTLLMGCQTAAVSEYNKEIISGGELGAFDYESIAHLSEDWSLDSGTGLGAFSTVQNTDAANYLKIDTSSAGYASASRKLYLKPFSYYYVEYTYTTSAMAKADEDMDYIGFYVGFQENPDFNIRDDKPTEERATNNAGKDGFYFRTSAIREVNLTLNVGTKDNPVKTSNVTVKSLSLKRVQKADIAEGAAYYELENTVYGAPTQLNLVYVILGGVGTLIIAYVFYILRARTLALEKNGTKNVFYNKLKTNKYLGLLITVGAALAVRLAITLSEAFIAGGSIIKTAYYGFDLTQLAGFGSWIAQSGTPYFFEYNPAAGFMPFGLYLSGLAGLFGRLIGLSSGATDATVLLTTVTMLKLFAVLADIGVVILIYKLISKRQGTVAGMVTAGFYALLPAVFYSSASVGTIESVTVFFVVLAFYFILEKKYIPMAASYFVACMFSPAALIAVPLILMYTAYIIYKAIKDKTLAWITPVVTIVASLVLYFLVSLPFAINQVQKGDAFFAFNGFIDTVKGLNVYSINAFNFQAMIGNNFKAVSTESTLVTILFVLFIVGLFAAAYFRNRNRLDLVMLGASFYIIYWIFCNNITPVALLTMFPLLLIYTAFIKDKRMYFALSMFAALSFINISYVYMIAGYTDSGITQLNYVTSIMYIMGAFNLLLTIYFVVIGYDTVVSGQASEQLVLVVPYKTYAKSVADNTVIAVKNFGYKVSALLSSVVRALKSEREERAECKKQEAEKTDSTKEEKGE
ncbi:MAG: hypothetical protein WC292_04860 [Clostridia bacterium]